MFMQSLKAPEPTNFPHSAHFLKRSNDHGDGDHRDGDHDGFDHSGGDHGNGDHGNDCTIF